ncbi:dolichol-phosphate mannosyltransferase subunit 3 [Acaromyces ingoldii]|uniref:Dolichol-phosphate mannosyltransferase subunit 3 n=1 Tax=Acaromyces ingoldii TaxID=215250 RepID=A0A316YTQ8_9BASI|nr:dolichol-phosphate mannosyltransferase subunit 3 [Acaromyces ingoldii]PWN92669.1 dolichol-phosphate mannosyltransferase subunit 3 [Acaromyces ingoldii]
MTRATRFFTAVGAFSLIWVLLLLDILPLPLVPHEVKHQILPALPWWVLVSTGSYLLFEMGWGIFNFNDVPKAYDDLLIDIKNAKDFLAAKGVNVD